MRKEVKELTGFIDDTVSALTDPIIVFPGGWGETLPDWLKERVKTERLIGLIKGEKQATDAEACAYLYTAGLSMPLNRDWSEIYQHLVTKLMGDAVPEDVRVESLFGCQIEELERLKGWIQKQKEKYRKGKRRGEDRKIQENPFVQLKFGFEERG